MRGVVGCGAARLSVRLQYPALSAFRERCAWSSSFIMIFQRVSLVLMIIHIIVRAETGKSCSFQRARREGPLPFASGCIEMQGCLAAVSILDFGNGTLHCGAGTVRCITSGLFDVFPFQLGIPTAHTPVAAQFWPDIVEGAIGVARICVLRYVEPDDSHRRLSQAWPSDNYLERPLRIVDAGHDLAFLRGP